MRAHPFIQAINSGLVLGLLATLATAAAVGGCSGSDPLTNHQLAASIAPGSARKSVGVISGIGHSFGLKKVGITVFGNSLEFVPIEPWGIDSLVVGKISAHLGKRFDVKRVDHPKGVFASLDKRKSILASDYKDPKQVIRDTVRGAAASQKCDLYLVVTRGESSYGQTNQHVAGLGIVEGGGGIFGKSLLLYALFEIRVYDGQTFEVLGHKRATMRRPNLVPTLMIGGPHRTIETSWWPPEPAQVVQHAKLKQATLELVEDGVTATIAELFPDS